MHIFGLADLHLALGVPEKTMEFFGDPWLDYHAKIKERWEAVVSSEDIVLLPGDISWAMDLSQAEKDFSFIDSLPGTKYMIRGNHDYWSSASQTKISQVLPPTIHYLSQGFARITPQIAVVGVRLWGSPSIRLDFPTDSKEDFFEKPYTEHDEKIFLREVNRLQKAFAMIPQDVEKVIVMTHYPPISRDGSPGPVSEILESDGRVSICLFGHLHKISNPISGFGKIRDIKYILVAADYVDFIPQAIL
ncbi:metallophosphoesterase [Chlamydia sp. 17-3921]|uniref:metallophosphoesterase n=1 Tax=Chlamydia sp. 17-3921 TaxID=2675798 RepID=UPI0019193874|nr:metallophosphoesterase [Chlamydia sp. 17-3921]